MKKIFSLCLVLSLVFAFSSMSYASEGRPMQQIWEYQIYNLETGEVYETGILTSGQNGRAAFEDEVNLYANSGAVFRAVGDSTVYFEKGNAVTLEYETNRQTQVIASFVIEKTSDTRLSKTYNNAYVYDTNIGIPTTGRYEVRLFNKGTSDVFVKYLYFYKTK